MIRKSGYRFSNDIMLKQKIVCARLRRFKVELGRLASPQGVASHRSTCCSAPSASCRVIEKDMSYPRT
jgi:hypothetical protein